MDAECRLNDPRPGLTYHRIIFTLASTSIAFLEGILNGALHLSAVGFCQNMIGSAKDWYAVKQTDANVQRNLLALVQYRPQGLKPYTAGVKCVA